jgi:hypothetical protein
MDMYKKKGNVFLRNVIEPKHHNFVWVRLKSVEQFIRVIFLAVA